MVRGHRTRIARRIARMRTLVARGQLLVPVRIHLYHRFFDNFRHNFWRRPRIRCGIWAFDGIHITRSISEIWVDGNMAHRLLVGNLHEGTHGAHGGWRKFGNCILVAQNGIFLLSNDTVLNRLIVKVDAFKGLLDGIRFDGTFRRVSVGCTFDSPLK